ncbi:MAG: transglutaminase domain-containing protein [Eubacteriales bacterium]|nr:transglutaminase domain-containing protein [Eubacteriales bacterium]
MKKLIRLFIAVFCIFFVLQAMPGSFFPAFRRFLSRTAEFVSEQTLLLAEKIDEITEDSGEQTADSGSGPAEDVPEEENPQPGTAEQEAGDGNGESPGAGTQGDPVDAGSAAQAPADSGQDSVSSAEEKKTGEESLQEEPSRNTEAETPEDNAFYYYYTRISREERLLYDAMLALAQSPEAGTGAEESRLLGLNPSTDEFAESYTRAYNALVTDHPELFWIAQGRAKYECRYYILPSFGGKYKIILTLVDGGSQGDASGGGTAVRSLRQAFAPEEEQLREAADAILDQVDLDQSDAVVALRLHDLLLESAWYNIEAGADDYAHTAYGALVEDSAGNPGGALCDGYALAYEYLLQSAGIPATMVCGYAGASENDTEKHAWNLVQLDGDWYEVDATWDDLDFEVSPSQEGYDLLMEALSDDDYMTRIRHYMFNRTTEEMRSFSPGEEYRYTSYNGWVTLLQPSVHIRFTEDESEWTRDYVTPLAPQADGTWYTWETLEGL